MVQVHPPRISRDVRSTATLAMVGKASSSSLIVEESASNGIGFVLGPPAERNTRHGENTKNCTTAAMHFQRQQKHYSRNDSVKLPEM